MGDFVRLIVIGLAPPESQPSHLLSYVKSQTVGPFTQQDRIEMYMLHLSPSRSINSKTCVSLVSCPLVRLIVYRPRRAVSKTVSISVICSHRDGSRKLAGYYRPNIENSLTL